MKIITREEALKLEYKGECPVERTIMENINILNVNEIVMFPIIDWKRKTPLNVAVAPSQNVADKNFSVAETIDGHYVVVRTK